MEDGAFRQFLVDAFSMADTVLEPGGVFYIWHADSEGYNFRGACRDVGWKVRECLIWNKNAFVLVARTTSGNTNPAFMGGKTARVMSGTQTEARRRLLTVIARRETASIRR